MGILRDYGKVYDACNKKFLDVESGETTSYGGLMDICNDSDSMARFGFGREDTDFFRFNLCRAGYGEWVRGADCVLNNPGWSREEWPWNQVVPGIIPINDDMYISLVFDGNNNKETIYMDGVKGASSGIGEEYWQSFLSSLRENEPNKIWIGRGRMDTTYQLHYTEMNCYTMRIYSRALSDDEIKENYKMSVAYHNFLENNGNSVNGDGDF